MQQISLYAVPLIFYGSFLLLLGWSIYRFARRNNVNKTLSLRAGAMVALAMIVIGIIVGVSGPGIQGIIIFMLVNFVIKLTLFIWILRAIPWIVEHTFMRDFVDRKMLSIIMAVLFILAIASLVQSLVAAFSMPFISGIGPNTEIKSIDIPRL